MFDRNEKENCDSLGLDTSDFRLFLQTAILICMMWWFHSHGNQTLVIQSMQQHCDECLLPVVSERDILDSGWHS